MFAFHSTPERLLRQQMTADQSAARGAEAEATASLAFVTLAESGEIDPVTAAEHSAVFAVWQAGVTYAVGQLRRYGDKLYRCITAHTAEATWTPDAAPSLWTAVGDPAEEFPAWSQPIGAADAYRTGDKVTHANAHWISAVDHNVWEPGVYGWDPA